MLKIRLQKNSFRKYTNITINVISRRGLYDFDSCKLLSWHNTFAIFSRRLFNNIFLGKMFLKLSFTYMLSCIFLLIVDRSMGHFMTFLYCGNCLVFTGTRNGHACSWHSISQSRFLGKFIYSSEVSRTFSNFDIIYSVVCASITISKKVYRN